DTWTTALSSVMPQGYNGGNDYHISWDNLRTTQDPNRAFVLGLYQDLLGRDSSTDKDVDRCVHQLDSGAWSRAAVVKGILNSAEYLGRQVDHVYQDFLGHPVNGIRRKAWINYLQHGGTEEEMFVALLASAEYQAKCPANAAFIRSLYDNLLSRGGKVKPAGVAAWVNVLNSGTSRADVVRAFLHSPEASMNAVDTVFSFLHRDAS